MGFQQPCEFRRRKLGMYGPPRRGFPGNSPGFRSGTPRAAPKE